MKDRQSILLGSVGIIVMIGGMTAVYALPTEELSAPMMIWSGYVDQPTSVLIWLGVVVLLVIALLLLTGLCLFRRANRLLVQRLREKERTLSTLLGHLPGVAYRCCYNGLWVMEFASAGCCALTGYTADDFVSHRTITFGKLVHPDDRTRIRNEIQQAVRTSESYQLAYRIVTAGGEIKWVLDQGRSECSPEGELLKLEGFVMDITRHKLVEDQAFKLSSALEQTADIVVITDVTGIVEYVNQAFTDATGYIRDEVVGKKAGSVKSGRHSLEFYRNLWNTILKGEVYREILINRRKNGELYYEEKTITPLKDVQGEITHFISTGKDITERMHTQQRLAYLAHHDALTALPNRALLLDRLEHALANVRRTQEVLALLFIDLDHFKTINDTTGHDVGDRVLQIAATRVVSCVRVGDTASRLGGDEFLVLLEGLEGADSVPAIAQQIIDLLSQPFVVDGREFCLSASIGISLCPRDGLDAEILLRHADIAMYQAKELGRNNYQFYSSAIDTEFLKRSSGKRK